MKTLLRNATIVTMNARKDVLKGDILIDGCRISAVGRVSKELSQKARLMDATDRVVIPGFVQTHVHLCQTLFRNLADDLELLDWLKLKIWPFEGAHNPASIALSARMGLLELIQGGTTTIMDMETVHHTDHVLEEIERSGMRAVCGKAMMDECPGAPRHLRETTRWSLQESLRLWKDWHGHANDRIRIAFAPRFVLSCSEGLLHDIRDAAAASRQIIHTHAAENRHELDAVVRRCGKPNIEYFHSIRLTGDRLCLAHCIWLNDREMGILSDTATRVLHCPSSNLKLGSGVAQVPEMLARGISVSLGADGAPCNNNLDMFQEMRLAALIQKPRLGPRSITAEQVFEMATLGGAKALGWEQDIGSIEIGKKADLVVLDLNQPHVLPSENIYSQIVYSAKSTDVRTVLIDGRVIMKDRTLRTISDEDVYSRIRTELRRLLRRMES